jgi:hypothetical protein
MGLDWAGQYDKITTRFASVVGMIPTTGADGKRYEMVCLPLKKLPGWLYSISPSKVRADLREKIVAYQTECDDALWSYWTQGHASRPQILQTKEVTPTMGDARRSVLSPMYDPGWPGDPVTPNVRSAIKRRAHILAMRFEDYLADAITAEVRRYADAGPKPIRHLGLIVYIEQMDAPGGEIPQSSGYMN